MSDSELYSSLPLKVGIESARVNLIYSNIFKQHLTLNNILTSLTLNLLEIQPIIMCDSSNAQTG